MYDGVAGLEFGNETHPTDATMDKHVWMLGNRRRGLSVVMEEDGDEGVNDVVDEVVDEVVDDVVDEVVNKVADEVANEVANEVVDDDNNDHENQDVSPTDTALLNTISRILEEMVDHVFDPIHPSLNHPSAIGSAASTGDGHSSLLSPSHRLHQVDSHPDLAIAIASPLPSSPRDIPYRIPRQGAHPTHDIPYTPLPPPPPHLLITRTNSNNGTDGAVEHDQRQEDMESVTDNRVPWCEEDSSSSCSGSSSESGCSVSGRSESDGTTEVDVRELEDYEVGGEGEDGEPWAVV